MSNWLLLFKLDHGVCRAPNFEHMSKTRTSLMLDSVRNLHRNIPNPCPGKGLQRSPQRPFRNKSCNALVKHKTSGIAAEGWNSSMVVLVIEDSRFMRSSMEKVLVKAGYKVVGVADGQEGVRLAQEVHPDVILLDMMLPVLEGTGVLRQLKKIPLTQPIPVIVLSGLSQKNESKLKTAGAAAYLEKSKINLEDDGKALIQAVEEVTGHSNTAHA